MKYDLGLTHFHVTQTLFLSALSNIGSNFWCDAAVLCNIFQERQQNAPPYKVYSGVLTPRGSNGKRESGNEREGERERGKRRVGLHEEGCQ